MDRFGVDRFGVTRCRSVLWRHWGRATAPPVERLLDLASARSSIVIAASPPSAFSSVVQSTAKGTAQILSTRVAGMSQKPNSAVATAREATLQIVIILHRLVERQLILPNERKNVIVSMPIGTKLETFRQPDDKNTRFSVTMRLDLVIPSSYRLEAHASSGKTRFFLSPELNDP